MTDERQGQNEDVQQTRIEPIMPDSDVGSAEELGEAIPEPALEMPDPEPALEMPDPEPETDKHSRVGVLDDESDEHPILVNASSPHTSELQQAYECLAIRTPIQEFHTYAGARLEALVRLGEPDRAEITSRALELGMQALRQAMGAVPGEGQ